MHRMHGLVSFLRNSPRWPDRVMVLLVILAALIVLWRPIVHGEVFLPLDLLAHMPPWRYSYERTPIVNPIPSDLLLEYYPRRLMAREMLEAGQLPLWNPYILAGTPLLADGYSGMLYPLGVLFWVLPLAQAFGWYAFLHLILAGLGVYALARCLGLRLLPGLLAAVIYQWCGFSMTWLVFPDFSPVLAWLPWIVLCVERYERTAEGDRQPRSMALTGRLLVIAIGVLLAFCVLCQLQLALYAGVAAGVYWLVRRGLSRPRALPGAGAALLAAGGLALLLSAAQWLPTLELLLDSQRSGVTGTLAGGVGAPWLLRFLSPTVFGVPVTRPGWGPPTMDVLHPYVGILPLLLAAFGAWQARTVQAVGLVVLALLALALALMPPAAFSAIPLLNQLPGVDRWTLVLSLALALLAGFGLQALGDVSSQRSVVSGQIAPPDGLPAHIGTQSLQKLVRTLWVISAIILVGIVLADWQLFTPNSRYGEYVTRLAPQFVGLPGITLAVSVAVMVGMLILVWVLPGAARLMPAYSGLCIVIVLVDLGWYGLLSLNSSNPQRLFRPTSDLVAALGEERINAAYMANRFFPATRLSVALAREAGEFRVLAGDYPAWQPNMPSVGGLYDVRGYGSLFSRRYLEFARRWEGKRSDDAGYSQIYLTQAYATRHMLDLMGVRYVFFNPGSANAARYPGLELIERNDEGSLYRNPTALPRAFLVHAAEQLPNNDAVLDRLTTPGFPVGAVVLLTVPPPLLVQPGEDEAIPQITHYSALEVRISVEPKAAALLVLSDSFFPGWQATVNGQPVPIYEVNAMLRGVAVQPGSNEIIFRYMPWPFVIGATISVATLVVLIAGMIWASRHRQVR